MRSARSIDPRYYVVLVAITARLVPGPRTIDDAYITFRYARNLIAGHGMVYNPGEWVFGASTPAYILLLAALGFLFGGPQADFPVIAWIVSSLADGATCWLLMLLGERLGRPKAGVAAALVWAIAPWSVTFAVGGMETSLFILLATSTFYFFLVGRTTWTALLGSLSLVTRPDALLFILPLGLERLRQGIPSRKQPRPHRPFSFREIGAFLFPVLAWSVYGFLAYGSPVPHSISAKVAAYQIENNSGLIRLLQHYATPFLGHEVLGSWWIGVGLVVFPTLALMGLLGTLRQRFESWPILSYPWVYFLAFAIANPLIFRWYLAPPLPVYFLSIFLGMERLSTHIKRSSLLNGLAGLAIILTLTGWTIHPDHGPARPAPRMAYIKLELLYQQAAEMLADELPPDTLLAAGDIGALGYFTDVPILDTVGLISPQAVAYYPLPASVYAINYAVAPELILDLKPDYVVILEAYGRLGLLPNPDFDLHYQLIDTIPTNIYGSDGMLIFKRRSA